MKFCSLASGSSGNCLYVESKEAKFLIDAGLSGAKIKKLMEERDLDPRDLDFILLTHEHRDHALGLGVMSRRYKLPIYTNEDTYEGLRPWIGQIKDENLKFFETEVDFFVKDLSIKPVRTYHDANDPVGYVIEDGKKKVSVVTDTGITTSHMEEVLAGSDMYFIEANFDPNMLENGPYKKHTRRRIRGDHGHLSNEESAQLIGRLLKSGSEKIYLGHLSENNNLPIIAKNTVETYLLGLGIEEDGLNLEVAKRYNPCHIHEL